jgi:hypothetical protein
MLSVKGLYRVKKGNCKRGDIVRRVTVYISKAKGLIGDTIEECELNDYHVYRKPRNAKVISKPTIRKREGKG